MQYEQRVLGASKSVLAEAISKIEGETGSLDFHLRLILPMIKPQACHWNTTVHAPTKVQYMYAMDINIVEAK